MHMNRRDLLKLTGSAALLAATGVHNLAFAREPGANDTVLVFLFLRGGCDVLNLIGPSNDPVYAEARAPDLRVLDSGDRAGLQLLTSGRDDFRLHPDAAPMLDLYQQKHLAIVHATGLTDETRSHFVAQDLMERGWLDASKQRPSGANGWMTRWLAELGGTNGLARAVSTTGAVAKSLEGESDALCVPNLKYGYGLPGGDEAHAVLSSLYGSGNGLVAMRGRDAVAAVAALDARLPRGADHKPLPYEPVHGAQYDENTDIGTALSTVARLIKLDVGLRAACVDMGGWDTHEGQPGRFNNLAKNLSRALAAFWNDVASEQHRVLLIATTEFGRRLRSNKSNGTDHGHGGATLALGGRVDGGKLLGPWPGLSGEALDRGVDLAVATDYRSVLAEAVAPTVSPAALQRIFPGFRMQERVGLLRA
jgi:uncharacterized protein (DUF1501 family)